MLYSQVPGYGGVKSLGSIEPGDKILGVFNNGVGYTVKPAVVDKIVTKKLPLYTLTTETGKKATGQNIVTVDGSDLTAKSTPSNSSFLMSLRSLDGGIDTPLDGKSVIRSYGGKPFYMDEVPRSKSIGWMLGVFLGVGGFIGKSGGTAIVQRAQKREGVAALWAAIISSLAEVSPSLGGADKNGYERHMRVSNGNLCRWLKHMVGDSAGNRRLPPGTLISNKEFRIGLLLGFMETRATFRIAPRHTRVWIRVDKRNALHQQILYLCLTLGIEGYSFSDRIEIRPDSLCSYEVSGWMKLSATKDEQYKSLLSRTQQTPIPSGDIIPCPSNVVNFVSDHILMGRSINKFIDDARGGSIKPANTLDVLSTLSKDKYVRESLPPFMKEWCSMAISNRFSYDRVVQMDELGIMSVPLPVISSSIGFIVDGVIHSTPE